LCLVDATTALHGALDQKAGGGHHIIMFDIPKPPVTASLPANLIGRWERTLPNGKPQLVEFTDDGFWLNFTRYLPVRFSAGGDAMVWGPESYTRLLGSGETVLGTWIEDSTGADYYFRTNGTFTLSEPGEIDIFGIFEINANTMRTGETRASVTVDGDELVFDVIYGGEFRYTFSVSGDTLTLVDGAEAFRRVVAPLDGQSKLGQRTPMLIYKIFRAHEWEHLRQNTTSTGAPIDVADGYIHFSTAAQAAETAAKHFAGQNELFLIAVDADALGDDLKWEVSRGDALFPHLYREMRIADVHWAQPLPLQDGVHQFPAGAGFNA
jgi:uncharacterized protein (DUF952 family)